MNRKRLITLFAAFLLSKADEYAQAGISVDKASDLVLLEMERINKDAMDALEEYVDALARKAQSKRSR